MRTRAIVPFRTAPPAFAGTAPLRRSQDVRDSKGLREETGFGPEAQDGNAKSTPRASLSQSGTDEHMPLWYGPTLRPLFVAQLLGQMMQNETPDHRSAVLVYGENARQFLRGSFDTRA